MPNPPPPAKFSKFRHSQPLPRFRKTSPVRYNPPLPHSIPTPSPQPSRIFR